jgi:D-proline reductase (dithiol) PrdB
MSNSGEKVNSLRFLGGATKRLVKTWIKMEEPREIPWTPLKKDVSDSKIALLSSGALAMKSDTPFDQQGERDNPWWGDPTHRVIPGDADLHDVRSYHLHIDPWYSQQDMNCLFPLDRLREMSDSGRVGDVAEAHYSIMGYILEPDKLLRETTPQIIASLQNEKVDVLLLVPA